ncbi:hypothetical protein BDN70DRAFT_875416 [Pholiota conissans]|uniref:Uncharacterized protein n=1 Tax=Pholiota conissans TaxID=109636 RepID=A0A9P5Z5T2_9AGAR|nr:hypothetical protein BDN70DRAFT_875416 [Pholiota conissans]
MSSASIVHSDQLKSDVSVSLVLGLLNVALTCMVVCCVVVGPNTGPSLVPPIH